MNRILVTGARAPAALDVMRSLARNGYEVYAADSLKFPLARFSSAIKAYVHLPSPRHALESFQSELLAFVNKHNIDLIFPTCEEVFYLSACKSELEKYCHVFCEGLDLLSQLHDKYAFQKLAKEYGLGAIDTYLVKTENEAFPDLDAEKTYVAKPAFSRFGENTILNLKPQDIKQRLNGPLYPWAIQEFIEGEEYCSYAICRNGIVTAEVVYQPYFRAKQGASVYFKAVSKPTIVERVRRFVGEINYTGQIAFDFIEQANGQVFVLECNPRSTSGVHLMADIDWKAALTDPAYSQSAPSASQSKMISLAMLMFGLGPPNTHGFKEFVTCYLSASDVVHSPADRMPSILQVISLFEVYWRSITGRQSVQEASTKDIEWDGQQMGQHHTV